MYTHEKVYDSVLGQDWLDLDTETIDLGASFGLGADFSITIPTLSLDLF